MGTADDVMTAMEGGDSDEGVAIAGSHGLCPACWGYVPERGVPFPAVAGCPSPAKRGREKGGLLGVSRFAVWGVFSFDATGVILPPLLAYLVLSAEEYSPATYLLQETCPAL